MLSKTMFLLSITHFSLCYSEEFNVYCARLESFLEKYSSQLYQDALVANQVIGLGTDLCENRYQLIQPILDLYKEPFSVLDLGAAQGYFSFSIAENYPHSSCLMIEANNTSYYVSHGDMLFELCHLNHHLKNICYLEKRINLSDLAYLDEHEHFDVVLALLVVHQMGEGVRDQIEIIEKLLSLGDNLILEVANDVNVIHTSYVEFLSEKLDCQYLGEVKRHKNPSSTSTGKLFWFKNSNRTIRRKTAFPIKKETFEQLHGVYKNDL